MDKNTITGLVLIAVVLIGFSYYSSSQQAAYEAALAEQQQTEAAQPAKKQQANPSQKKEAVAAQQADTTDLFFQATKAPAAASSVVLQNDLVSVKLNTQGGGISAVNLKNYKSYADFHAGREKAQLVLFDEKTAGMNFQFETVQGIHNSSDYHFAVVSQSDSTATLAIASAAGDSLFVDYRLVPGTYMVNASPLRAVRWVCNGPTKCAKRKGTVL